MSVTLVNGSVLLPTRPNWRDSVSWKRSWQTTIAGALQGHETRRSLRRIPRVTLNWLVTTLSAEESAVLETRINAALKSGLACTGYWGHACEIASDVTGTTAALYPGSWPWAAGDYILFIDPDSNAFDAIKVDGVSGNTLTLHSSISQTYKACWLAWPILFGKLQCDPLAPFTSDKLDVKLTLLNALPPPATVPGETDWCGHCNPGSTSIPGSPIPPPCISMSAPTGLHVDGHDCPTASFNSLTPTLTWGAVTGAASYQVKIYSGSCGGTLLHTSPTLSSATYTVPGGVLTSMCGAYYWQVTATASSGYCSNETSSCCEMVNSPSPTPCVDCTGAQPAAVVSNWVNGSQPSPNMNGSYPFASFDSGGCAWRWNFPGALSCDTSIGIVVQWTGSDWHVIYSECGGDDFETMITSDLQCCNGVITGHVHVVFGADGASADISFGGG